VAWAIANANLALVKYWGKLPGAGNQAASGSISVTLDGLATLAGVRFDPSLREDRVEWRPAGPSGRVVEFLDRARRRLGTSSYAQVLLASTFPVAAGLASSASTFAALATATAAAAGAELPLSALAALAREGSGSACRSLLGGFVEWRPGSADEVAAVFPEDHWPLAVRIAVTSETPKPVSSREGMLRTARSSPYYGAWIAQSPGDLAEARSAIAARDLGRLGTLAERNCLRMHAAALASDPPLLYWEPATVAVVQEVWSLRRKGIEGYFTIDAGPQVKVLCDPAAASAVETALAAVPGVGRVLRSAPGRAPELVREPPAWAEFASGWVGG
jgi:diphosphomevalonate decarboxylase